MYKVIYQTWNSCETVGICSNFEDAQTLRDQALENGDWNPEEDCWIEEA